MLNVSLRSPWRAIARPRDGGSVLCGLKSCGGNDLIWLCGQPTPMKSGLHLGVPLLEEVER